MTVTGGKNYVTDYAYDANNRLITETKETADVAETTTYHYDPNGNQVSKVNEFLSTGAGPSSISMTPNVASGAIYRYNGLNQLVESYNGGHTVTYTYYATGLRASKVTNGTETKFILDGGDVVAEQENGSINAKYVRGMNLLYSVIGNTTSYYLYNAHGDVVQLANASGTVTKQYDYDAFGVEESPDAGDVNPFRYCGEYWDLETNTYYLRARYYNPTTGRFLTEDPIRNGLNYYTYCNNNPILFLDPFGLAEVAARAYAEGFGATVTWTGNTTKNGKTYASATVEFHGKKIEIKGELKNGSLTIDDSVLNNKFGWGSTDPVKNAVLQNPALDHYAQWDLPYKDNTSSPYEGITQHSLTWVSRYSGITINVYEGSKESMKAWADHIGKTAGCYDFAGYLDTVLSALGIVAKTAASNVIFTSAEMLSASPWVFAGFIACQVEAKAYSNTKDFIINQTYFQQGTCYFTYNMWIGGYSSTTLYDNNGNKINHWGR